MRRPIYLVAGAVAFLILAGAAFFFLRPQEPEYRNVDQLVRELRSHGIACGDLQVSAPNPTPELADFGACTIDGDTVSFHVYRDVDAVEGHIRGNLAVQGDNPNYFTSLVAGRGWVIDTYSDETSRRIQEAIGGEIH